MMNHRERITPVTKLKLKFEFLGQVYVIIVMHTSMLKEQTPKHRDSRAPNNADKNVIFEICTPFTNSIIEISNTKVDMPMILP